MTTLDVIDVNALTIASPCKASWNAMEGDDRARFCGHCDKHVYNIATLTRMEVSDLVRRTEGDFCGQLYRRRDGTVLTADCPIGAPAFSSGVVHRVMTYAVLGIGFLATALYVKAAGDRSPSWPPTGSGATFSDWTDWARRTLGLSGARSGNSTMGVTDAYFMGTPYYEYGPESISCEADGAAPAPSTR